MLNASAILWLMFNYGIKAMFCAPAASGIIKQECTAITMPFSHELISLKHDTGMTNESRQKIHRKFIIRLQLKVE
jgi:hypothetical protein